MNNRTTKTLTSAAAAALALGLGGCINPTLPTPSPTPMQTVDPTPTPSPSPTLSLTAEQEAAADAVLRFYEIVNQVASNDEVDLNSVYEVAGGETAQAWLRDLQAMKVAGLLQVGSAEPEVRTVEGLAEPYTVETCVDTSKVNVVNGAGDSVVGDDGPTRILYHYTVETVGSHLRVTKGEAVSSQC